MARRCAFTVLTDTCRSSAISPALNMVGRYRSTSSSRSLSSTLSAARSARGAPGRRSASTSATNCAFSSTSRTCRSTSPTISRRPVVRNGRRSPSGSAIANARVSASSERLPCRWLSATNAAVIQASTAVSGSAGASSTGASNGSTDRWLPEASAARASQTWLRAAKSVPSGTAPISSRNRSACPATRSTSASASASCHARVGAVSTRSASRRAWSSIARAASGCACASSIRAWAMRSPTYCAASGSVR